MYAELEQIFRLYCAQYFIHKEGEFEMNSSTSLSFTQMTSASIDLNIFELHSGLYIYLFTFYLLTRYLLTSYLCHIYLAFLFF